MDIEEFYDADPRRRSSAEFELGTDWTDGQGVRFEVSWVEDTGELYVMREPAPASWATPFGGVHVRHAHGTDDLEQAGMTVGVVAAIPSREQVETILEGWEAAVGGPNSIQWVVDRLRAAGYLAPAPAAPTAPGTG